MAMLTMASMIMDMLLALASLSGVRLCNTRGAKMRLPSSWSRQSRTKNRLMVRLSERPGFEGGPVPLL